jgi:hypothetical protein
VFVADDLLVVVTRGDRVSSAQLFGVDWGGPKHTAMHASVFDPIRVAEAKVAEPMAGERPALHGWRDVAVALGVLARVVWLRYRVARWYVCVLVCSWLWYALR